LFCDSGPGATNTLTGVADAMMDSTPIVVIAGQVGVGALGTDAFQEVDLVGVAQPITKWAYQIRRPEDVAWAVSRAFYIARSGRPGPVVLDFPKNAQNHTCEWDPIKVENVRSYNPYPKIDSCAIEEAAKLINGAKKPFALVGQGSEMASDTAGKLDVIRDAFKRSEEHYNKTFDYLIDLDATAPLRSVEDIIDSFKQFKENNNDNLITAMPSRRSPYFNLVEQDENGKVYLSKKLDNKIIRRQDAPKSYDMNASIYIWKRDIILNENSIFLEKTGL
jgi:hypothetical protein